MRPLKAMPSYHIYIYINRRVIFTECLIVFQSICSKSTRKCNSDQIPSVEFYYESIYAKNKRVSTSQSFCALRPFSLMCSNKPCPNLFVISFISFYFWTLLVKRHPLNRSVNSRKTHHGCENSFTFCSNEGDHIASVTLWMTPHKRTQVRVRLCVSLPSRHSTNPQVLRKLWRTSWSRWTLLDVCQVRTLVLQQRNCRACE